MNAQPMISCHEPVTPSGNVVSCTRLKSIEEGWKNGSTMISTSGMIEPIPSTVAKVAPRRMPSQPGMKITTRMIAAVTSTPTRKAQGESSVSVKVSSHVPSVSAVRSGNVSTCPTRSGA